MVFQKQPVCPGIVPLEMYNTVLINLPEFHQQKFNKTLLKVQKTCKKSFGKKNFSFRLFSSLDIQRPALKALSKAKRQKLRKISAEQPKNVTRKSFQKNCFLLKKFFYGCRKQFC